LKIIGLMILLSMSAACSLSSPWKLESIDTGERLFDSARLIYSDSTSPLRFEIIQIGGGTEAFLSLTKYKFNPTREVNIELHINEEKFQATLPLLEGKMRLRFPSELTKLLINALQEGKQITIMADGFNQQLAPAQ
jgi:hypothetical protein